MEQQISKQDTVKVFISSRQSRCDECKEELGSGAWIILAGDKGAVCLTCADIDHLVFLSSGDAALTRRSQKYSTLFAVVLKWSKARKRYERQGLLVEEDALKQAEIKCLADEDVREQRRIREAERRAELDGHYIQSFYEKICQLFPKCPSKTAQSIAEHACTKYSGRVGRSAAAKSLDENAVGLAVRAHVRHVETVYDKLLMKGWDRAQARLQVQDKIEAVLVKWQGC
ncbi:MAG: DUF2293 domain-containing protein [Sedimentisphaerales bacterium]